MKGEKGGIVSVRREEERKGTVCLVKRGKGRDKERALREREGGRKGYKIREKE